MPLQQNISQRLTIKDFTKERNMSRARVFVFAGVVTMSSTAVQAQADPSGYPNKPVRIIVGFTPGSATDITARVFAQKFSELWSVPVTVENTPGAGGTVGAARAAKAPPDGYTLKYGANGAMTIAPSLYTNLAYDPARDFTPVSLLLSMGSIVAVNNDVPVKTLQQLIALAREQPGKLSYASPGVGVPQHVGMELLKSLAGVNIVHVPYKGAMFTDVIGGRVTMTMQNAAAILPTVREGRLRGLAQTSLKRSPNIPEFPTVAESGYPGFETVSWFGLLVPVGTPAAIVNRLHQDSAKVLAQADTRATFTKLGLDMVGSTPAELAATIKSDVAKWAKVIKEAGISATD
jgi:tripartite-type tricarboxylate transporter receptor subunit TctC